VIQAVEAVTGRKVPHRVGPRREGDAASLVADSSKLQKIIAWRPSYTQLEPIVATAWDFERRRVQGERGASL
jgi:UDP-glucose 4-epimerase